MPVILPFLWPCTQAVESRKPACTTLGGREDPQLGLPWDSTPLAAVGTTAHLALHRGPLWPWTVSPGWELYFQGLWGPLAEGVAHSCGLLVLGKQKGWHKNPSPVTSWRPGPGKELV